MRCKYQDHFVDGNGKVVKDGTIAVYNAGTTDVATIYADSTTLTPIAGGVVTSGTDGYFSFWSNFPGPFKLVLTKSKYVQMTYDYVYVTGGGSGWCVSADLFGDDTQAIVDALASIENGCVALTPNKTYTGDLTISEDTYRKELWGNGAKISGSLYINGCRDLTVKDLEVGGVWEVNGAWDCNFDKIYVLEPGEGYHPGSHKHDDHYLLVTNGLTANYGTYWNSFTGCQTFGIIIAPGVHANGGVNRITFRFCRSNGALSNSAGDHTDTLAAGIRIMQPNSACNAQDIVFQDGDLSYNWYAAYNESKYKLFVQNTYCEVEEYSPVYFGLVDFKDSYFVDYQYDIPFDLDNLWICGNRGRTGIGFFPAMDLYGNPGFREVARVVMPDASIQWLPRGVQTGTYTLPPTVEMTADPDGEGTGMASALVLHIEGSAFGGTATPTSLSYSSTTKKVTVVHNTHGRATGDIVKVAGAVETAFNGRFNITKVDGNTYTYKPLAAPTSTPATGTITVQYGDPHSVRFSGRKAPRADRCSGMLLLKGTFSGSKMNAEDDSASYTVLNGVMSADHYNVFVGKGANCDVDENAWLEIQIWPEDECWIAQCVIGCGLNLTATNSFLPQRREGYSFVGVPTEGVWVPNDMVWNFDTAAAQGSPVGWVCEDDDPLLFREFGQLGTRSYNTHSNPNAGPLDPRHPREVIIDTQGGGARAWKNVDGTSTGWRLDTIEFYNQGTEPTLNSNTVAIWRDSDDGKIYLVADVEGSQKKVELT